ncbi:MAG TPA: 2Fe-2S iron-sulfur cluster-binding protein, partial [Candidatus Micrarchaeota archaeon]|nr:2Fe-2S iron-sulfur cluster-binding protein [Candidatus Micrarchaeota archaeon]
KIVFKSQNIEVEVPAGSSVADVCDSKNVPFPFSCRSGVCTTCLCNVLEGAEILNEKGDNEKMTLEGAGAKDNQRLGCQLKIEKEGKVVLESVEY